MIWRGGESQGTDADEREEHGQLSMFLGRLIENAHTPMHNFKARPTS